MTESDPFDGWGAKRDEQMERGMDAINAGEVRMEIACEEARRQWFTMARDMYVANNPEPRFPIDLEIGIHLGKCDTEPCQRLRDAYQEILRPSHPGAAELLAEVIDTLEANIIPPEK